MRTKSPSLTNVSNFCATYKLAKVSRALSLEIMMSFKLLLKYSSVKPLVFIPANFRYLGHIIREKWATRDESAPLVMVVDG